MNLHWFEHAVYVEILGADICRKTPFTVFSLHRGWKGMVYVPYSLRVIRDETFCDCKIMCRVATTFWHCKCDSIARNYIARWLLNALKWILQLSSYTLISLSMIPFYRYGAHDKKYLKNFSEISLSSKKWNKYKSATHISPHSVLNMLSPKFEFW